MVSDVLADAVAELRAYLARANEGEQPYADWYGGGQARERIESVIAHMESVSQWFDNEEEGET
jgi:threonine aldolase